MSLKIQLQEGRKLVLRPVVYQETRVEKDDARVVDRMDASFASDLCLWHKFNGIRQRNGVQKGDNFSKKKRERRAVGRCVRFRRKVETAIKNEDNRKRN